MRIFPKGRGGYFISRREVISSKRGFRGQVWVPGSGLGFRSQWVPGSGLATKHSRSGVAAPHPLSRFEMASMKA
jgi:hypothetical protein